MSEDVGTTQVVQEMELKELGEAKAGSSPDEVVIALSPAFGDQMHRQTLTRIPHAAILRELFAGIEEEEVKARVAVRQERFALARPAGERSDGPPQVAGHRLRVPHQGDRVRETG